MVEGGSGRRLRGEFSFFRDACFLGIPGIFSQENGMPENRGGVTGLVGESPEKEDSRDEEQDESEEKDWDRREDSCFVAGNLVSLSLGTILVEESMAFRRRRKA